MVFYNLGILLCSANYQYLLCHQPNYARLKLSLLEVVDGVGKIVEFVAGYVHREPAVRSAEGRLLGHPRHGRHSVHLLLHRQDPGGVSVRGGCGDR